jgi:hypothetical protein
MTYPFWQAYGFWAFVLFVLTFALGGLWVAAGRGHSLTLRFAAGALCGIGGYVLLRYRGSVLQARAERLPKPLRPLYLASATLSATVNAVGVLSFGFVITAGRNPAAANVTESLGSWMLVPAGIAVGLGILVWIISLSVLLRTPSLPRRGEWITALIVWPVVGAYWWLSHQESARA